jgi:hypothetical protein
MADSQLGGVIKGDFPLTHSTFKTPIGWILTAREMGAIAAMTVMTKIVNSAARRM